MTRSNGAEPTVGTWRRRRWGIPELLRVAVREHPAVGGGEPVAVSVGVARIETRCAHAERANGTAVVLGVAECEDTVRSVAIQ